MQTSIHMAGRKIREWREGKGWTQQHAAHMIGCSKPTYWRIENDGLVPETQIVWELHKAGVCALEDWFSPAPAAASRAA